ncbi:MAG: hypothetical protein ACKVTZ_03105 [Bacteroidia bacterium]
MANQHYIYTPHRNSNPQLRSWDKSMEIGVSEIAQIRDTVVKRNEAKAATSVPSPFARMHLFETAFELVMKQQEGDTMYHKLVSDCLDMFQLLFDMSDDGNFSFIRWSKPTELELLKDKAKPREHRLFSETLAMFLEKPRFVNLTDIILIHYKNELLGGTSPLTVFFTSPNWGRKMREKGWVLTSTTTDNFFDEADIAGLHQRDEKFQLFMMKYFRAHNDLLFNQFPSIANYIHNYSQTYGDPLSGQPYTAQQFEQEFEAIPIGNNMLLNVSGLMMYRRKQENKVIAVERDSSFVIQPSVSYFKTYKDERGADVTIPLPLVLVNGYNQPNMTYIQGPWNPETPVPSFVPQALHERILPGNAAVKYPFLVASDFLADSLIELPYDVNEEFFYTGFNGNFPFLLPIRKEYFNFFTLADLRNNLSIARRSMGGSDTIAVDLKIPIKNGKFITFSKEYNILKDMALGGKFKDEKAVTTANFGFGIFPFYQVADQTQLNDYSIMVADKDARDVRIKYLCFPDIIHKKTVEYVAVNRIPKQNLGTRIEAGSVYHRLKGKTFDFIEVQVDNFVGIIIPEWARGRMINANSHVHSFTFGVDFGTSNSHIAYRRDTDNIMGFDIQATDIQVVMLNKPQDASKTAKSYEFGWGRMAETGRFKKREFVPSIIGSPDATIIYPIRTATCESIVFRQSKTDLFANINIGYSLDAEQMADSKDLFEVNIKWGMENNRDGGPSARERVKAFILQTVWMIKNKILLNSGRLDQSKIVWFIPLAMRRNDKKAFREVWNETVTEVFGDSSSVQIFEETESAAPYFFLRQQLGLYYSQNAVNIDIGGGTSDLLFFAQKQNRYISTSFRFAANDIWGDGFAQAKSGNRGPKDNGFVLFMHQKVTNNEIRFQDENVKMYYDTCYNNPNFSSSDVISFMFKYNKEFNLGQQISKHPLRAVLVLHFAAIVYHVGQITELAGIDVPLYFIFTGRGSEYIRILGEEDMKDFAKIMLKKAQTNQNTPIPNNFKLLIAQNPKEATANGGVAKISDTSASMDIHPEPMIHAGIQLNEDEKTKEFLLTEADTLITRTLENFKRFLDILFDDREVKNFLYEIELSLKPEDKDFLYHEAELSFEEMSHLLKEKQGGDERLPETMFFWCLKGILYKWSRKLYNR